MAFKLPTEKTKVEDFNPKFMVLYGKPKQGKSTIMANIENNFIIDLEDGYRGLSVLIANPKKAEHILMIQNAIREEYKKTGKKPYKFITIDNATRLEDFAIPYAGYLYQQTPMGKNWDITKDVRYLPNGSGYMYLRNAIDALIYPFRDLCDTLILIGHAKNTQILRKGESVDEMSFDLSGKSSLLVQGQADAVGYIYREKESDGKDITYVSFESNNNTICESRCPHLRGKKFPVIITENGETKIDTSKLFI